MRHGSAPVPLAPSRIESFGIHLPGLDARERTVHVYLPPGYDGSTDRFPVLYLQDGQQLFTAGYFGDWRVDESMDSLVLGHHLGGLIVVGIDNGARRWDEYGPWVNAHMLDWVDSSWSRATEGGRGAAYVSFMVNTLKPEIDARYRTKPGREQTGIGGSSMGGLIALYAGLSRPDVFSKVMAMSTAVWQAERGGAWLSDNQLLSYIRATSVSTTVRIYMDVGTDEHSRATDPDVMDAQGQRVTYPRAYLEGSQAVVSALTAAGVSPANLKYVVDDGGTHNERSWARRFPAAVLWLFQ